MTQDKKLHPGRASSVSALVGRVVRRIPGSISYVYNVRGIGWGWWRSHIYIVYKSHRRRCIIEVCRFGMYCFTCYIWYLPLTGECCLEHQVGFRLAYCSQIFLVERVRKKMCFWVCAHMHTHVCIYKAPWVSTDTLTAILQGSSLPSLTPYWYFSYEKWESQQHQCSSSFLQCYNIPKIVSECLSLYH